MLNSVAHACNPSTFGVQDEPRQHGKTLSLLKKKLAGRGGACLWYQLPRRLRQENYLNPGGGGCGELRSPHCTPAWVTRVKLHLKTKKQKTKSYAVLPLGNISHLLMSYFSEGCSTKVSNPFALSRETKTNTFWVLFYFFKAHRRNQSQEDRKEIIGQDFA